MDGAVRLVELTPSAIARKWSEGVVMVSLCPCRGDHVFGTGTPIFAAWAAKNW